MFHLIHPCRPVRALALAFVLVTAPGASSAWASDLRVANATSPAACAKAPHFTTVQAAVTAANPGDHIKLCPGTYTEQVKIPAGKDNISLEGNGKPQDPNQPAKDGSVRGSV
jgi:pectin methylesterase-like acyl-CoA thioesterase